jgi:hypothetical protein
MCNMTQLRAAFESSALLLLVLMLLSCVMTFVKSLLLWVAIFFKRSTLACWAEAIAEACAMMLAAGESG